MEIRRLFAAGAILVLLWGMTPLVSANPYAVFVVHCEPKNADPASFLQLRDMVVKADQHQVKLTIDFTPQWAEMILEHPVFSDLVTNWHEAGHELGAHHHPYWVSKTRGTNWDGYTNTPQENLLGSDGENYLGDMDDYLALLNELPGTRTSGTLGLGEPPDAIDWPQDLLYSAAGHAFEDIVSRPQKVEYAGHVVWQMKHGLLSNGLPEQVENAYAAAVPGDIVAVVTHVSNYEDFPQAVENYFAFLGSQDPSGNTLVTVTEAMNLAVPEPSTIWLALLVGWMLIGRHRRQRRA